MTVLRGPVAAVVFSGRPTREFGSPPRLRVQAGSTQAWGLIQFGLPKDLRKGATVLSAKLRVQSTEPWPGSTTLSAHRVTGAWQLSRVNWSNRPVVASPGVAVTKTNAPDNAVWEFDVAAIVQQWVDSPGTYPNRGFRITTSSTAERHIWGAKAPRFKPTLEVTYSFGPATPTALNPSAGAVSVSHPVLSFTAGDITALRVQIDPEADEVSPDFDSGMESTTDESYALAGTAFPGLSEYASTSWRVQVQDETGRTSDWSEWATFTRRSKSVLTITQPGPVVYEATPPIAFTLATPVGIMNYRLRIALANNPTKPLYDSGRVSVSELGGYTVDTAGRVNISAPPVFTVDGAEYVVSVRVWDFVERDATTGDPDYVEASVTTTLQYDPGVVGVDWLSANRALPEPWVDVVWSRSVQPDGWVIVRDGKTVHSVDAAYDLLVSGTSYAWRDWTAAPNRLHSYMVLPVVNGRTSGVGPVAAADPSGSGVWLADPETGQQAVLWGDDAGTWTWGGDATVYTPVGSSVPVRVTTSVRGVEGSISGLLLDSGLTPDQTADVSEAALWDFKGTPGRDLRLVAADFNVPVQVYDVGVWPDPSSTPTQRVLNASFGFYQTGEMSFEVDF